MSTQKYTEESPTTSLVFWMTGQMLKGAGMALAFLLAIGAVLGVIWAVSMVLPEASKTMPSPYSALEAPLLALA